MHFAAPSASDIGGLPKKQKEIRCAGPLAHRRGPKFYGCFMKPAAGHSGAKRLPFWAGPVRSRIVRRRRTGFSEVFCEICRGVAMLWLPGIRVCG